MKPVIQTTLDYFQSPPDYSHIYSQNNLGSSDRRVLEHPTVRRLIDLESTPENDMVNPIYEFSYMAGVNSTPVGVSAYEGASFENVLLEEPNHPRSSDFSIKSVGFKNPSKDGPVRVRDFLEFLDLSAIMPTIEELYGEKWKFRYNPEAVLRTLIYWKLKGYKFLSQAYNELITNPDLAYSLGFEGIPSDKQLYHFIDYRLTPESIKRIFDAFLKVVKDTALNHGIEIGEGVMIDGTPLKAKKKDPDADYNGHYKVWGYKLQNVRCVETGMPLDYHVHSINEYDGFLIIPLLYRLRKNGIEPRELFVDCSYVSFENMARLGLFWSDMETTINIAKGWKIHKDANKEQIYKWYAGKFWDTDLYAPKADFEYQQMLLVMTNDGEYTNAHDKVGAYYRNKVMKKFYRDPIPYMEHYHTRNRIEHHHGLEKLMMSLNDIYARGIKRFTAHVGLHIIALMALVLCRLQNGVSTDLMNLGGLI